MYSIHKTCLFNIYFLSICPCKCSNYAKLYRVRNWKTNNNWNVNASIFFVHSFCNQVDKNKSMQNVLFMSFEYMEVRINTFQIIFRDTWCTCKRSYVRNHFVFQKSSPISDGTENFTHYFHTIETIIRWKLRLKEIFKWAGPFQMSHLCEGKWLSEQNNTVVQIDKFG